MEKEEGGRRRRRATAEPGDGADSVVGQMMLWHRWLGGGHRADGVRWGQGVWVGFMVLRQSDGLGLVACLGCSRLTRCLCPIVAQEGWFWSTVLGPGSPWTVVIYFCCLFDQITYFRITFLANLVFF